ncbi:YadA C-terminal domain-containing protein [Vibrio pelagius]|uniref:YadA C-terminal domain-containing protein n=1 Tax=Vibrio pelagius TaxID=28169 RepID=UPI0021C307E7|nr:YadA C-terminal domain-containing protein [Vibrio pelagius]
MNTFTKTLLASSVLLATSSAIAATANVQSFGDSTTAVDGQGLQQKIQVNADEIEKLKRDLTPQTGQSISELQQKVSAMVTQDTPKTKMLQDNRKLLTGGDIVTKSHVDMTDPQNPRMVPQTTTHTVGLKARLDELEQKVGVQHAENHLTQKADTLSSQIAGASSTAGTALSTANHNQDHIANLVAENSNIHAELSGGDVTTPVLDSNGHPTGSTTHYNAEGLKSRLDKVEQALGTPLSRDNTLQANADSISHKVEQNKQSAATAVSNAASAQTTANNAMTASRTNGGAITALQSETHALQGRVNTIEHSALNAASHDQLAKVNTESKSERTHLAEGVKQIAHDMDERQDVVEHVLGGSDGQHGVVGDVDQLKANQGVIATNQGHFNSRIGQIEQLVGGSPTATGILDQATNSANQARDAADAAQSTADQNTTDIQYNSANIAKNELQIKDLREALKKQAKRIDGGMAQASAFAGLVSPYNVGKINTTVALGHSGSANALALGAGMRINEQFTVKLGGAYDTGTEQVSSYVGAGWEW